MVCRACSRRRCFSRHRGARCTRRCSPVARVRHHAPGCCLSVNAPAYSRAASLTQCGETRDDVLSANCTLGPPTRWQPVRDASQPCRAVCVRAAAAEAGRGGGGARRWENNEMFTERQCPARSWLRFGSGSVTRGQCQTCQGGSNSPLT